ncbi:hypothetical protein [Sphingomonas sp. Leaf37]|uniref:hypothetical protein n=1 Tax=Sphingomonas sp. Leaf37 TaxID=2876552 RepID=UPI001E5A510D|nr:hypothetical protein [Sphingomonas sp. Leaf37]
MIHQSIIRAIPVPGADPSLDGMEPAMAYALADELVGLTGLLAELAFDLASDSETLRRHMHSLQVIDRITQAQLAIADVLRSTDPIDRRLETVTLEDLGLSLSESLDRYRREGLPVDLDNVDTG